MLLTSRIRRLAACLLATLAPLLLPSCGPSNGPPSPDRAEEIQLEQVGMVLREYQLFNARPPKSIKELQLASGSSPGGFELIKTGEVIVGWGATLPDTKEEPGSSPSEEVLAYLKKVPEAGGPVLMLNRTIRRMTPEEFKAAAKAGKP